MPHHPTIQPSTIQLPNHPNIPPSHHPTMHIYKSPYPDVALPTVGLFQYLAARPISLDLPVYIDYPTKRSYTRGQAFDKARRLAWGLRHKKGLKSGDTVLLFGKTSIEYPIVVLGCIAAGLVPSLASAA
jgi:hypothetical protein